MSLALWQAIFEASSAGTAVLAGPQLRFSAANAAYRALTPHPEMDPIGRTFSEVWPGEDRVALPALQRALETGEPSHAEEYDVPSTGGARRFSLHVKPVAHEGTRVLLVYVWETTELWQARREAERAALRALRRASELDAVIEALPDGFVLFGPQGEILRLNAVAERLIAPTEEDRGLTLAARFARFAVSTTDGRRISLDETPVARALSGEATRSVHLRIERAGASAWVLASAAPIRAPDGGIWGAVLTFSDASPLHALEEARDDLIRMVSHDLRTPLNAVVAQAHLLRRDANDPDGVKERAASIARSCDRMAGMIQDLLAATLLEAGQLRIDRRQVDLDALVHEVLERHRGVFAVERVRVVLEPPVPSISCDPHRLERIVVNLISNALKYSPREAEVSIRIAAVGHGVAISVADQGVGIAPDDLPHVFERFFRSRSTRRAEGIGLGLYITRLLVLAHGGRMEVESVLGTGSTFRVFLPCEPPSPTPPPGSTE